MVAPLPPTFPIASNPLRRLAVLGLVFVGAILSCGRDVTGPLGSAARFVRGLSFNPVFPPAFQAAGGSSSGVVSFNRVHVVLHHSDGTVALDTTIDFPAGADEITVSLTVKLLDAAPGGGEAMSLNLGYLNAAGDTVFKGGPVSVTAAPPPTGGGPNPPVQIPVSYSGPGSTAASVLISPRSGTVVAGAGFNFTAIAKDNAGATLSGTPIIWNSLDPSIATITSAAAGAGNALNLRGTARIIAQLLTGPADTVVLTVTLPASQIIVQSGNAQSGIVGTNLAAPLVVKVAASDGVGVAGSTVNFAVATGGGSVANASVVSDASGLAQTTWKLGTGIGAQSVTASSGTLTNSPLTFTATAQAATATKLVVTTQPVNGVAGIALPAIVITAEDNNGNIATTFTGPITLALGAHPAGATLRGAATVNAVAGVATFTGVTINKNGTAYTLVASATGLTSATTGGFDIAVGAPSKLDFTSQPASTSAGSPISVAVTAEDKEGNAVTTFAGAVSIGLGLNPGASTLGGTTSATAIAGVATFPSLTLNRAGNGYTIIANAADVTSATSAAFDIDIGPAASLVVASGDRQSGTANSPLAGPVIVQVTDLGGNGVAGKTVTFTVTGGGGSVSAASRVSDGSGYASTNWTLGPAGGQAMSVASAGLRSTLTVVAVIAAGGGSGTMTVFGGNNQFAVANTPVLTPPSVLVKDGANNPVSSVAVTFTPSAGSSITGPASVVTGINGIATVGGWTLGLSGSFTLSASATGYTTVVFTGTVNTVPMSVSSAEKLPNGTQQFQVNGGNPGDSYTWTVNGIVGGNSTFGTIDATGFYVAPAAVPSPATFAVCAQSVQTPANKGCINVTITATPTAGGELIVMNDINWGDIGLSKSGANYSYPGNAQFVKNLVAFTPTGVRSSATNVLFFSDNPTGAAYTPTSSWPEVGNIITGLGYSTAVSTLHSDLNNIPSDVKLLMITMPGIPFAVSEINGLKTFASQGGRIIFFGENGGYYSFGLPLENAFLASMGALMTNTGACDAPGVIVNSVPHQLTTGISASGPGGFYMNCVSHINLGPNDFALMTEIGTGLVMAGIAKIDYTLLPLPSRSLAPPSVDGIAAQQLRNADGSPAPNIAVPLGLPGWTSTGPPTTKKP